MMWLKRSVLIMVLALMLSASLSFGYVLERSSLGMPAKWNLVAPRNNVEGGKVLFWLNDNGSADIADGSDITALRDAFAGWEGMPTIEIAFQEHASSPTAYDVVSTNDNINLLIFVTDDPDLAGTGIVGFTTVNLNPNTGIISDADIRFNEDFDFAAGVDLYSVILHEVGHLFGLDHSPVSKVGGVFDSTITASMYPSVIGTDGQSLEQDDISGASVIYPSADFSTITGGISGKVYLTSNGALPTFGAHVVAIDKTTGVPVVATTSDKNGNYVIQGIPAGTYVAWAEPLPLGMTMTPYYNTTDRTFSPMLFDNISLVNPTSLVPGDPVFDSAAEVNVVAGNIQTGVDFLGPDFSGVVPPAPPPGGGGGAGGGGGGGSSGGCSMISSGMGNGHPGSMALLLLPLLMIRILRRNT